MSGRRIGAGSCSFLHSTTTRGGTNAPTAPCSKPSRNYVSTKIEHIKMCDEQFCNNNNNNDNHNHNSNNNDNVVEKKSKKGLQSV